MKDKSRKELKNACELVIKHKHSIATPDMSLHSAITKIAYYTLELLEEETISVEAVKDKIAEIVKEGKNLHKKFIVSNKVEVLEKLTKDLQAIRYRAEEFESLLPKQGEPVKSE